MDEITDGCKLPTEGASTQLTDIQRAGLTLENRTTIISLFQKERLSLCEGKEKNKKLSYVCLVWRCWWLGFGVMWCCAVMFLENRSRFTYCKFTNSGRKTFAAAVPPLSTQLISAQTLIHFLFLGRGGGKSPPQDRFPGLAS